MEIKIDKKGKWRYDLYKQRREYNVKSELGIWRETHYSAQA